METEYKKSSSLTKVFGTAVLETLWPSRCALCDCPGTLLCDSCRKKLPYLDQWNSCPRCGAPHGRHQCCTCNPMVLSALGKDKPPFTSSTSATLLNADSGRIISLYKDAGEKRLAKVMAALSAPLLDPAWKASLRSIAFVPATTAAVRKRGFDHGELFAKELSVRLGLPLLHLFARPKSNDQRALSRQERFINMQDTFKILPGASVGSEMLISDDVFTTGATLFAACDALLQAGTHRVRCITFARTP